MNKLLLALGILAASALLIPDTADAQRGRGGGFIAGGGCLRSGTGAPESEYGLEGFRGGATAAQPAMSGHLAGISPGASDFRQAAINTSMVASTTGNYFGNRNDWRYGVRAPGSWNGRYPYYDRYPYYGGWGLAAGAAIGAAATYPYYNYPYYNDPYYSYPYSTYLTLVASAGGYCVTPILTCALTRLDPVGTGCSYSTPGGRARSTEKGRTSGPR